MAHASLSRLVPISSIQTTRRNPRGSKFDIKDLMTSLRKTPQLHPLTVRRVPGPGDRYELLAGHRRLAAAKKLGWAHVEVKVVDAPDDTTASILTLEENLRRKALPDEATAMAELAGLYARAGRVATRGGSRRGPNGHRDRLKSAAEHVADVTGQSVREVRRKVRIGRLGTAAVKGAVAAKQIPLVRAEKLVGLAANEQDRAVAAELKKRSRVPEGPAEVRRALASIQFAARVLRDHTVPTSLAGELREAVRRCDAALKAEHSPATPARILEPSRAVWFEPKARNGKIGFTAFEPHRVRPRIYAMGPFVSATSVSILATCPATCPFKGTPSEPSGCYVRAGFTAIQAAKLDRGAFGLSGDEVIAGECRAIDDAFDGGPVPQDGAAGGRDLRLHVGGDVPSVASTKMLARAARRWRARGGGAVWTYTHSWRTVPRSAWGDAIAVLASVEHAKDIEAARKRRYASIIVVDEFPSESAFTLPGTRSRVIPCPAETRGTPCVRCRLCLDRNLLAINAAIGLRVHGQHGRAARTALA